MRRAEHSVLTRMAKIEVKREGVEELYLLVIMEHMIILDEMSGF